MHRLSDLYGKFTLKQKLLMNFFAAIEANDVAAINGLLLRQNKRTITAMIKKDAYESFICAARLGHVRMLDLLWSLVDEDDKKEMLAAQRYYAFRVAIIFGHVEAMKKLWELAEDWVTQMKMLKSGTVNILCYVARNGSSAMVRNIREMVDNHPGIMDLMLNSEDGKKAFLYAAQYGNSEMLSELWAMAGKDDRIKSSILKEKGYRAFKYAIVQDDPRPLMLLLAYANADIIKAAFGAIRLDSSISDKQKAILSLYEEENSDFRRDVENLVALDRRGVKRELTRALEAAYQLAATGKCEKATLTPYLSTCFRSGLLWSDESVIISVVLEYLPRDISWVIMEYTSAKPILATASFAKQGAYAKY